MVDFSIKFAVSKSRRCRFVLISCDVAARRFIGSVLTWAMGDFLLAIFYLQEFTQMYHFDDICSRFKLTAVNRLIRTRILVWLASQANSLCPGHQTKNKN
jgi:hypothetical protein